MECLCYLLLVQRVGPRGVLVGARDPSRKILILTVRSSPGKGVKLF